MLIIRLSALGDVGMTIPAIYSLAKQYPTMHIDVLTRPFFARLMINPPANINIITADFKGEHRGVRGVVRLLKQLSQLNPKCVADLHNVLRSWIINAFFWMKGVNVAMVDKNRQARKRLFSEKIPQRNFVDRYADVFAKLGYPIKLDFTSVYANKKADAPFEPLHPAVGIAPFARYYNKTYPPEMMKQVATLLARDGWHVYLFGGRGREADDLHQWDNDISGCKSVAGEYTLEQEIALMSRMDVMVSMDSANQHLAALAGCRAVTVWGSTTPACGFMGYNQRESDAVCLNLPCQPCSVAGKPTCPLGHLDCMCSIKPKMIVEKVKLCMSENVG